MTPISRKDDGSLDTFPDELLDLAPIFSTKGVSLASVTSVVAVWGDEGAATVAELALSLAGRTRQQYASELAEGWQSAQPLIPVLETLGTLDARVTYRALIAQRIGQQQPEVVQLFSPFYRMACGLAAQNSEPQG